MTNQTINNTEDYKNYNTTTIVMQLKSLTIMKNGRKTTLTKILMKTRTIQLYEDFTIRPSVELFKTSSTGPCIIC